MEVALGFSVKNIKYADGWTHGVEIGKLLLKEKELPEGDLFDLIVGSNTNEQFKHIVSSMKDLVSKVIGAKRSYYFDNGFELNSELNGRLLAFSPFFTCCDGIAASESEGLLDETNQPLKAFWIDFLVNLDAINSEDMWESKDLKSVILVSWIPEKYIQIIDYAISENGDDSLYWLN